MPVLAIALAAPVALAAPLPDPYDPFPHALFCDQFVCAEPSAEMVDLECERGDAESVCSFRIEYAVDGSSIGPGSVHAILEVFGAGGGEWEDECEYVLPYGCSAGGTSDVLRITVPHGETRFVTAEVEGATMTDDGDGLIVWALYAFPIEG